MPLTHAIGAGQTNSGDYLDMFQATSKGGPPPTTFVLKPQHADDPHAQLLFKMDPNGGMVLLPNEFTTKHLHREVETFITR